jgi:hypothetical protein
MVDGIRTGDLDQGFHALLEHTDLIRHRVIEGDDGKFEVAQSM